MLWILFRWGCRNLTVVFASPSPIRQLSISYNAFPLSHAMAVDWCRPRLIMVKTYRGKIEILSLKTTVLYQRSTISTICIVENRLLSYLVFHHAEWCSYFLGFYHLWFFFLFAFYHSSFFSVLLRFCKQLSSCDYYKGDFKNILDCKTVITDFD